MGEARAKVFWSGRSQAVRLPKEFRFEDGIGEVAIRRQGKMLILELPRKGATEADEWAWLDEITGEFDEATLGALEEDEGPFEDRPERDEFFK